MTELSIEYDHALNLHTLQGALAALSAVFGANAPKSLLDVGCGTGTWLRAASQLGVATVFGIDGILMHESELHVPKELIQQRDLTSSFNLGRRFDVAICLEVAEHLPEASAAGLISSITSHSDRVLFSAACPGQSGQHHINCQWPAYWQALFNASGFACDDAIRWQIWNNPLVEPWYRQNMFWARLDRKVAGHEPRIEPVIHPDIIAMMKNQSSLREKKRVIAQIENGHLPLKWYLTTSSRVTTTKFANRIVSWLK
jgi:SAM-dependent methyltransferase